MPAKTVHLTNAYHPSSGGISTFYRALLKEAPAHRRQIRLIVPGDASRTERVNEFAIIYHIKANRSAIGDSRYRLLWPWGPTGGEIKSILRLERPDLVEIADKYTLHYLAGLLRKRWLRGIARPALVGTSHERFADNIASHYRIGGAGRIFAALYMKWLYFPAFDWHIANSEYTAGELIPASKGHTTIRPVRILPMGVDCESFDPRARTAEVRAELLRRAGAEGDKRLLLYVGRLSAEKNLRLLVDMMHHLGPEYLLIIAGEGPMKMSLQRQFADRGRFIGHVRDRSDLALIFAGADVFVHPNPREPFGIAPLEAMAAGLPVVLPAAGGVLSYADTDNSWLAQPTGSEFASRVAEAFSDSKITEEKAVRARLRAEAMAWPRICAKFFELFDHIAASGRAR